VFVIEVKNCLFLPLLEQQPVTHFFAIESVDFAVAFEPIVVLAGGQFDPPEQGLAWQVTTLGLVIHVFDNVVEDIVGDQNVF
jgi:hypothetical protein